VAFTLFRRFFIKAAVTSSLCAKIRPFLGGTEFSSELGWKNFFSTQFIKLTLVPWAYEHYMCFFNSINKVFIFFHAKKKKKKSMCFLHVQMTWKFYGPNWRKFFQTSLEENSILLGNDIFRWQSSSNRYFLHSGYCFEQNNE
jgi:hypothetical protein